MPVTPVEKIWFNGKLINWFDAKIHILSHVVHYGSSWFEGIRCYETKKGSAVFRLDEHISRLFDSAKIYRAEIPFTKQQLIMATIETIKANNLKSCYIRPIAFRGYGDVGVNPFGCPVDVSIIVWQWGKYLGDEALKNGIDVCVSSWNRLAQNTMPTLAKTGSNYMNSQLIKMEAIANGYVEGIGLDQNGKVSEGSGENLFVIKNNIIYTPPLSSSVLPGITRASVIQIAKTSGYNLVETEVSREMLYIADELFFTGTAAEITPIRSVDKIIVGAGKPGPITLDLQKKFFDVVENGNDPFGWLHLIQ